MSDSWTKKRGKTREEHYQRDGVWVREFYARLEPWPVVEQWATDHGFSLAALRGKRRLYQKGDNASLYQVFLDIREREEGRSIVMNAWVQAGWLSRLLHLWRHGKMLKVEPTGWAGVWKRREACRDFNDLLQRFRQLPIVGTDRWHIADVDPSTLMLLALFVLPIALLLIYDGTKLEVAPALSNALLVTLSRKLVPLLWVAPGLLALHHFLAVRRFDTWLARGISMGASFVVFTLLSVILMTRTASEMAAQKVSHHCLYRFDERACHRAIEALPAKERAELTAHLSHLGDELARGGERANLPAVPRGVRQ